MNGRTGRTGVGKEPRQNFRRFCLISYRGDTLTTIRKIKETSPKQKFG